MSSSTAWMAWAWSGVSSNGKVSSNSLEDQVGRGEGVAGQGLPLGVQLQQLLGHLARLGRDPPALLLPGLAAQLVQPGDVPGAAHVAADQPDPVDRHVDAAAVVFEVQEVLRDPAHLQLLEAAVTPDPVLLVDRQVPLGDLAQVAQPGRARGRRLAVDARARRSPPPRSSASRSSGSRKPWASEPTTTDSRGPSCAPASSASTVVGLGWPAGGRTTPGPAPPAGPCRRSAWVRFPATSTTASPSSTKRCRRARRACPSCVPAVSGCDSPRRRSASSARKLVLDSASSRRVSASPLSRPGSRARAAPPAARPPAPAGPPRARGRTRPAAAPAGVRPDGAPHSRAAGSNVAAGLLPDRLRVLHHEQRVGPQVLQGRHHLPVENRGQRLDPEEVLAGLDLLEQVAGLAGGQRGGVGRRQHPRARLRARGQDGLAHRMDVGLGELPQSALAAGVEQPHRLELVAVQLEPHRVAVDRGEQIHHRPPHRE